MVKNNIKENFFFFFKYSKYNFFFLLGYGGAGISTDNS
jgi:hypothetical protein